MHEYGISIYPDLTDMQVMFDFIDKAAQKGYKRVFTSMILNDQNFYGAKSPSDRVFSDAITYCKNKGMQVFCDFNRNIVDLFGSIDISLNYLKKIGVYGIRIDGGLTNREIAEISTHNSGLYVQINCSDIRTDIYELNQQFERLMLCLQKEGDLSRIEACFNFYPRLGTGISLELLEHTTKALKKYEIPVCAFVSSNTAQSFLHTKSHGITTCERLRCMKPYISAKILLYLGIDHVFFGDTLIGDEELEELKEACEKNYTKLLFHFAENVPTKIKKKLRNETILSNRLDQPEDLIRCCETRCTGIEPFNIYERPYGSVTIDNNQSAQYEGEIQIVLKNLEVFDCANVVGYIDSSYLPLLDYLRNGKRCFLLKEDHRNLES